MLRASPCPPARVRRPSASPAPTPPRPSMDFAAAAAAFLADQQLAGRAPLSLKRHRNELRQLSRWMDAEQLAWHVLTERDLRRYVRSRPHLGPSSCANMVWTLRSFFAWATQEGEIVASPAALLTTPRRAKPIPRALTKQQVRRLVAFLAAQNRPASRRDEALILTALYTGARRQELAAFIWEDIDLVAGTITIRLSKMDKGRVVAVHEELVRILGNWRGIQGGTDDGPVFDWGGESLRPDRIGKIIGRSSKRCGIPFTPHTLRHTFATHAYRHGRDIQSVSKALGHAELRQTLIYVAADPEDSRVAVESLPDLHEW